MSEAGGNIGAALWGRVRDILLVADRLGTFAFGEADVAPAPDEVDDSEAFAKDFIIRAVNTATDGLNWSILSALVGTEGVPLLDLSARLRVPRMVVSERVSDLVQVGLAARMLDADTAHITGAGETLAEWISAQGADLAKMMREKPRTGGPSRGLPLL